MRCCFEQPLSQTYIYVVLFYEVILFTLTPADPADMHSNSKQDAPPDANHKGNGGGSGAVPVHSLALHDFMHHVI